jgi:chromate transporter
VVGVIANLAIYVALHTLFAETNDLAWGTAGFDVPGLASVQPVALCIGLVAALVLFAAKWPVLRTLGVCASLGLAAGLAGATGL